MRTVEWHEKLPGGQTVREGLADYQSGCCTVPACLVSIARTRLTRAGLLPGALANPIPEPERQLYRMLLAEGGDAYARYNALLRELISFEQALERRSAE